MTGSHLVVHSDHGNTFRPSDHHFSLMLAVIWAVIHEICGRGRREGQNSVLKDSLVVDGE
jgi:hypothetical protein